MATKQQVTKVWIEPGCIVCDACETTAPTVFEVLEDTCIIRPAAMNAEFTKPLTQEIIDAAEECPVDVIKYETVAVEVADDAAAPAEAPAAKAEPAAAAAPKPAPAKHAAPKEPAAPKAAPKVAAEAPVSVAGATDPAIAALLRAATSRGGSAGVLKRTLNEPDALTAAGAKGVADLPPDARQAKMLEAARKIAKDEGQTRRDFMSKAAMGVGWLSMAAGIGIGVGPAFGRFMMPNVLEEPDPRVRVGKLRRYSEMKPGDVIEDYKPQGIWMIRDEEHIAALSIICTHLGCIPNWLPNDRKFKCPCHGSGYKPNGVNFEGPTPRPLERFRLFVEDGVIVVDKSKKYQYELGQWSQAGSFLQV